MRRPCIAVVEHLGEGLGAYCFRRVARPFDADRFDFLRIEAWRGTFPEDAGAWVEEQDVRAVILDGAIVSPLDAVDWLPAEAAFIRKLVPLGIPALGICFGHEMLAAALGGTLRRRENYEVAMHDVEALRDDPVFSSLTPRFRIPVAHSVEVVAPPPEFVLLATAGYSPVQAMRHERLPVYGVQFHPEVDAEIKAHDPDWARISDAEFAESRGDDFMENFARLVGDDGRRRKGKRLVF